MTSNKIKPYKAYRSWHRAETIQGYVFLSPALIIIAIFTVASVLFVGFLSFNKVNLYTGKFSFIGFTNYLRVASDDVSYKALSNTAIFSLVVVPIQTILALIVASVLHTGVRAKKLFRSIYFLPTLTSSSALTIIFLFLFNIDGPFNSFLIKSGILTEPINFLNETAFVLKVIMAMNIWSTVPMYMTLYLASLQDLPKSLYEAAEIDGAGAIQKFFSITIPYLRPITTLVLLTGISGTFQMFDQAYIFSNGSGGPENATLTVSLLIYKYAFGQQNAMGYASAMAIILAIIIFTIAMITNKLNKEERVY